MKIIELLNKIANGEEPPEKIKVKNFIYEYRGYMYCTEKPNYQDIEDYIFGKWNFNILNDEVEIIEEEKKIPEKLNIDTDELRGKETPRAIDYLIESKINQVIDYLNSEGE